MLGSLTGFNSVIHICLYHLYIAATISFNQSEYSVDEDERSVKPVLILSNPSSTDITLQVKDEKDTATG